MHCGYHIQIIHIWHFISCCLLSNLDSVQCIFADCVCIQGTEKIWWSLGEALSTAARFIGSRCYTWLYSSVNICFSWLSHHVIFHVVSHDFLSYSVFVIELKTYWLPVLVVKWMNERILLTSYTGWSKKWYPSFIFAITSANVHRF